jgi:hypothetical protein
MKASNEKNVNHLTTVMVVINLRAVVVRTNKKLCLPFQSMFLLKLMINLKKFKRSLGIRSPKLKLWAIH